MGSEGRIYKANFRLGLVWGCELGWDGYGEGGCLVEVLRFACVDAHLETRLATRFGVEVDADISREIYLSYA